MSGAFAAEAMVRRARLEPAHAPRHKNLIPWLSATLVFRSAAARQLETSLLSGSIVSFQ
jgi:hypothetical protein